MSAYDLPISPAFLSAKVPTSFFSFLDHAVRIVVAACSIYLSGRFGVRNSIADRQHQQRICYTYFRTSTNVCADIVVHNFLLYCPKCKTKSVSIFHN